MKTRPIEMYRIHENGTWDTDVIQIPATTHPSKIEEVAIKAAKEQIEGVADFKVYNTMDDSIPELEDVWMITVVGAAKVQQRFVVEGVKSKDEALTKMGKGEREEYGQEMTSFWKGDNTSEVKRWPG